MPAPIAIVVITMGGARLWQALISASKRPRPRSRRARIAYSTSRIEFFVTMPINISTPMTTGIEKGWCVSHRANSAPTMASGNADRIVPGCSEIEVAARIGEGGEMLVTTVLDRGPGVPPDMLQAIFEPFTRIEGSESVRGTGLGLAIARSAMLLHGGSVEATLREGGGLAVTLSLPRRD
jgi:hypothetical protein